MAKKTNEATVEASPLEERLKELQAERRELEAELAALDGKLRDAINSGDVESVDKLTKRKLELPGLFISASMAETAARHEYFNAEDEANLKVLQAAESDRDKAHAAVDKRQKEVEEEMAELKAKSLEADTRVGELYAAITASRDLGASGDAGFKKSLAALAGV